MRRWTTAPSSSQIDSPPTSSYLDGMEELQSLAPLDAELEQRIAEDPLGALLAVTALRRRIQEREREAVFRALLEMHSWREVGEALGVSKQAAFQRFGVEWAVITKAQLPKGEWKQVIKDRLTR